MARTPTQGGSASVANGALWAPFASSPDAVAPSVDSRFEHSTTLVGATPRTGSRFIAGPAFDAVLFILAPMLALTAASAVALFESPFDRVSAFGGEARRITFFINIWTWAHLTAVFFRSHANPAVFAQHRVRFTLVPLALIALFAISRSALVTGVVIAFFWDIYHTSMQNFGFCRIYDARLSNPPEKGRWLDLGLNHVLYIGPILAGLSLRVSLQTFDQFKQVGWETPSTWVPRIMAVSDTLALAVFAIGVLFLGVYVWGYWRLAREGYRISRQKLVLLASTGIASIWAWGFLPPVEAFFVANLYHALQYFGIVWWTERGNMQRIFGLSRLPHGAAGALLAYGVVVLGLGLAYECSRHVEWPWALAVALTVSLMHFYYDGFVWSVRRREV